MHLRTQDSGPNSKQGQTSSVRRYLTSGVNEPQVYTSQSMSSIHIPNLCQLASSTHIPTYVRKQSSKEVHLTAARPLDNAGLVCVWSPNNASGVAFESLHSAEHSNSGMSLGQHSKLPNNFTPGAQVASLLKCLLNSADQLVQMAHVRRAIGKQANGRQVLDTNESSHSRA